MNMNDLTLMGMGAKDTLWMEAGWGSKAQTQGQLSDAEYAQVDARGVSSFYNTRKDNPTPYATTTLVNANMVPNNRPDSSVSSFT